MIKKFNLFNAIVYLYVLLPIMIFLLGWTRWFIAIPGVIVLAICWFRMSKDDLMFDLPKPDKHQMEILVFVLMMIVLWVYLSGIGKFVFQNTDHDCRNPIFDILVNYKWPATRQMLTETGMTTKGLIYYIGFWMPAAVVGKLFGLTAGYCFQAVWAVIGIFLVYMLISSILKEIKIWPLLVMIFFSGMDILGYFLVNGSFENLHPADHLEWWCNFQFSSMTTQLFWVFNQAAPAWLICLLIYKQKKNKYIAVLLGCALLCSTLPFVGMLPFVVYWVFSRNYELSEGLSKWRIWIKDTFSLENIFGGGIAGIISFIYLIGNEASQNIVSTSSSNDKRAILCIYILFIIIEIGCYFAAIYQYQKRNPLFYISFLWLCFCPCMRVGFGADFCMRASIPALFMLMMMVMQTLQKSKRERNLPVLISLIVILLIGSVTPWHEIIRTTSNTMTAYRNHQPVYSPSQTEDQIFGSCNFSGTIEDSFFFRYLAKR